MVDDVRNITETAESKEALDRARLARERREAEQRKRLDELRAHAAAAQAQREKRDDDRRRRQAEQRAKDDDRRVQVEERKRAIWEASISRREALLQRERDRTERLERARVARSTPRPAFAFGSSTPRLLDPLDSAGFFWAARSTNPLDQMNFFESLAASTTNVMFASAPLTRRASALQLDTSDTDNKDEPDRQPPPVMWSSVARRRTDLVPTVPLGRAPGRAHSMTRLDRLPPARPVYSASPSMHHLNRTQTRSGETTPGSRPGSALSNVHGAGAGAGVVRRPASAPRKPRPASIAGTGVNTPRGGCGDVMSQSVATTPSVSRDSTVVAGGDAPRRPATTPRRPRPASLYAPPKPALPVAPGEGKPPLHRKPKPSKDHDKTPRGKSLSASPGRTLSPSPAASKEPSVDKDLPAKSSAPPPSLIIEKSQVSAAEVTQKLEALQIQNGDHNAHQILDDKTNENKESVEIKMETKFEQVVEDMKADEKPIEPIKPIEQAKPIEVQKHVEREEKKEPSQEKTEDNEMTASMTARRITTEEQAKAALAERRRRAREELERQAELERQRLQREAEEEEERQRQEKEREHREEEEARELAQLQRRMDEEKLRKAIEAQQQLERDEAERKVREEVDRQTRVREEEEKRKAAEEAERLRREEAEKEEKERLARKQRVEAIMARTRLRKAEEDKKQQEKAPSQAQSTVPATGPVSTTQETSTTSATVQDSPANVAVESAPAQVASVESAAPQLETSAAKVEPVAAQIDLIPAQVDSIPGQVASVTEQAVQESVPMPAQDNGNAITTGDLLGFNTSQVVDTEPSQDINTQLNIIVPENTTPNNGNVTADLLGLSEQNNTEDKAQEQSMPKPPVDNAPTNNQTETSNGNVHLTQSTIGHISANFLQTERTANENQTKMADAPKLLDDDFTTHNGHGATHNHPLTLQNAI